MDSADVMGEALYYDGVTCRRMTGSEAAFNERFDESAVQVLPGEACWIDDHEKMLVTQVGSGVALSIFDQQLRFGVLAHCLLPDQIVEVFPHFEQVDPMVGALAVRPIEAAVNEMKRNGAGKGRIRIRLFGGAHLPDDPHDAGTKTYIYVKSFLLERGLQIMSEDIGGTHIRRVHFFPETGAVSRFKLRRKSDFIDLKIEEEKYLNS